MVITINGMFPGTLINATTNDNIHVNVFSGLDEPLLMTWNGIQQRLNSWQDGVSGTNCPIQPDVHIGQSYSVLVTANQLDTMNYFMVANPTQSNSSIIGVGVLQYANSTTPASGPLPVGPNLMDREFSVKFERFDPRTISWESVPSMKTSRGGHSVAAFNEKIYAFGGFDGTRNVSEVEVLDPRFGSWTDGDSMHQPRVSAGAVVIGESIYVIGGV
ncbi:hypothetical protein IFM89_027097 [Coptis chinensis]|uniref:Plastocyanin-like domain-containing protein n=1 Tax=Coptis chinensis TaxID=261450 RepID=A0A835H987_9MAGN|nr:hypothetical protein IFM89_027097 [Coptis chinensis]